MYLTKGKIQFPKNNLFAAIETSIFKRLYFGHFWAKSPTKLAIDGKLITFCEDMLGLLGLSYHAANIPPFKNQNFAKFILFFFSQKNLKISVSIFSQFT